MPVSAVPDQVGRRKQGFKFYGGFGFKFRLWLGLGWPPWGRAGFGDGFKFRLWLGLGWPPGRAGFGGLNGT